MPSSEAVNQLCSELCTATARTTSLPICSARLTPSVSEGEDGAGLTPAVLVVSLNYAVVALPCRHVSQQPHHPLIISSIIMTSIDKITKCGCQLNFC